MNVTKWLSIVLLVLYLSFAFRNLYDWYEHKKMEDVLAQAVEKFAEERCQRDVIVEQAEIERSPLRFMSLYGVEQGWSAAITKADGTSTAYGTIDHSIMLYSMDLGCRGNEDTVMEETYWLSRDKTTFVSNRVERERNYFRSTRAHIGVDESRLFLLLVFGVLGMIIILVCALVELSVLLWKQWKSKHRTRD